MRLLLPLVVLAALAALAQEPVRLAPGHPDLAFDRVTLASGVFDVALVEPSRQPLGTVTETVERHAGGTVTVVSDVDIVMGRGGEQVRDTTRYAWPALAPLDYVGVEVDGDGDEVGRLRFEGLHVDGSFQVGAEPATPIDLDLAHAVFGPGSTRKVVRALPFEAGYRAVVPTFTADDRLEEVTVVVVGQEDVARSDGETVAAWIVEETDARGRTRQYAVDPDTRDLLRIAFAPASGYLVHFVRQ